MRFHQECLVIKIGSSLLMDAANGGLHRNWLHAFLSDVAMLRANGCSVIIVSSGAVALGCQQLGFDRKQLSLEKKQAAAAVGQIQLSQAYQQGLEKEGLTAAQILLSLDDSENRRRYINARNTLLTLLKLGMVPIVNENDTIATAEIRYGDNDRLAARVAQMVEAQSLLLLSDIQGFYTADPNLDPSATLIKDVHCLSDDILALAGDSASDFGSGGMKTKLAAAKIAMACGCKTLITAGKPLHPIQTYLNDEQGSWFYPAQSTLSAKKAWLKEHLNLSGRLVIDDGAVRAIEAGKSLLPVGIIACQGQFQKGEVVGLYDQQGCEIAKGICNYAYDEVAKLRGLSSSAIPERLGYNGIPEVVHCDNLMRT